MARRPVIGNFCLIGFPNLQVQYFNQRLVKSHLAERVGTTSQFQGTGWSQEPVAGSWAFRTDEAWRGGCCRVTSHRNPDPPPPPREVSLGGSGKAWHPETTQQPSSGANKRPVLFLVLDPFCVFLGLSFPKVDWGRVGVSRRLLLSCHHLPPTPESHTLRGSRSLPSCFPVLSPLPCLFRVSCRHLHLVGVMPISQMGRVKHRQGG